MVIGTRSLCCFRYWHSYVTHTDVIWRREHLSGAQPAQGISIDECGTAGYNQHAGLVKTQSKAICARNFNHDKDGHGSTWGAAEVAGVLSFCKQGVFGAES